MIQSSKLHPQTLALHAGYHASSDTGAIAVPIYQTTAYQFHDADHAKSLFALSQDGDFYTRVSNPTVRVLEDRITAIEGGKAAVCVASGQAAVMALVQSLARVGDNIVTADNLYGGTITLFQHTLRDLGIEVRMISAQNAEAFAEASNDKTRLWFAESLPNPSLIPFPMAKVAALGHRLGIPLAVDNTSSPVICRPFDHGVAIVIHSLTKYCGGSGNSLAGVVIDSGHFDWAKHATRQPALNTPDPAYHDIIWTEACCTTEQSSLIQRMRFCGLRDIGYSLSPMNAFLILQGLESLHLRIQAHCRHAEQVAHFLAEHKKIKQVVHPTCFVGDHRQWAEEYLSGCSPLVGVHLHATANETAKFVKHLHLFHHVSNIGDSRSLVTLPSATTHSQLDCTEQAKGGINEAYIRLSVGIEHIDDIIADLQQALESMS